MVGEGCCFFQKREGADDLEGHPVRVAGDFEVLDGALGLCAPVHVGGHLHLAHGVFFDAVFHAYRCVYGGGLLI